MSEFMQYSEEWKQEIKKLPKNTIIEIASQIGIEKQKEVNSLKEINSEMLRMLSLFLSEFEYDNATEYECELFFKAKKLIKKATE